MGFLTPEKQDELDKDKVLVIYTFENENFDNYKTIKVESEDDIVNDYIDSIESYLPNYAIFKEGKIEIRRFSEKDSTFIKKEELKWVDKSPITNKGYMVEFTINGNIRNDKVIKVEGPSVFVVVKDIENLENFTRAENQHRSNAAFERIGDKYIAYNLNDLKDNFISDKKMNIISAIHFKCLRKNCAAQIKRVR